MNENSKINWSDEQLAIFDWFKSGKGNLVVQARAGTGKTTTIKEAFSHAPEERMLYAVFNKKNQVEAAAKITDPRVEVKTLHSLGFRYIKRMWRDARPDDKVEWERIDNVLGFDEYSDEVRSELHKLIGFAKNTLCQPDLANLTELAVARDLGNDEESPASLAQLALKVLEESKFPRKDGRISFNDMVWLPVACDWVRPWFNLVVVDEAQDMNTPQLMMAMKACKKFGRVCVVGDDRQAIYGFRGAAQDGMGLMKGILNASTLGLTVTYRCPKLVVQIAQQFVPDYRAASAAPEGVITHASSEMLLGMVEAGDAVLSRSNAPLMPLCLSLLRRGVPAAIEGRDVGKMLTNIAKKLKGRSVPDFLAKVSNWETRMKKRAEKSDKDVEKKIAEYEDQAACLVAVAEGAKSVSEVMTRLEDLFRDSEYDRRPKVILSSVHKAKGLEWDSVYMLTETFLRKRPGAAGPSQEEENIYYVAVTRSKRHLVQVAG